MTLKHVALEESVSDLGKVVWRLSGPSGEIPSFLHWQEELSEDKAFETRKAYAIGVAQFFDYLYESAAFDSGELTSKQARNLVLGYKEVLEKAESSNDRRLRAIANGLPHKLPLAPRSVQLKLTAMHEFLEHCEDLYDEAVEVFGLEASQNAYTEVLGGALAGAALRGGREVLAVRQNSMLGGVIRRAASSLKKRKRLAVKMSVETPWDDDRDEVPMEWIGPVIEGAHSWRDKALYTLLACGGLRTHEALLLEIDDLDFDGMRVDLKRIISGGSRRDEARRKGRSARFVYFWPGYQELFFGFLNRYLQDERRHLVDNPHAILFTKIRNDSEIGRPLYEASDGVRDEAFKAAQRRAGVPLRPNGLGYGLHALRHSYGVFMANHCPWIDGVGIPLPIVQRLMGHQKLESTQIYARDCKHKIDAVLNAGRRLYGSVGLDPNRFREYLADSLMQEAQQLLSDNSLPARQPQLFLPA